MMEKKISRRQKVLIIVAVILTTALISANLFTTWYVKNKLEGSFFNKPGGYHLHFEKLRVNVFTGTVSAVNIHLSSSPVLASDTTARVDARARSVKLSRIGLYSLFFKKIICISEIQVQKPEIILKNIPSKRKSRSKKHFSLYDFIHPKFKSLRIMKIEVDEGNIKTMGRDSSDFFFASDNFSFEGAEIIADSTTSRAGKIFGINNASVSFKNIHGNFTKGLYSMVIPSLSLNTKDSIMIIDSLLLSPTVDKRQFAKKLGYQTSCKTLMLASVRILSGKFLQFVEHGDVLIDTVQIGYAKLNKYRDKNIPRKLVNHSLQHTFLTSLHFKIDVQALKVANADVVYEKLNPGTTEPSQMNFNNVKAELYHYSNTAMNDTMKINANGSLMSKAAFKINLLLPLAKDEFYATGTMGPYDMQMWNSMLKDYSPPMEIKSGLAKSMQFSCYANKKDGTGTMTFIYSDLTVHLLNKKKQTGGIRNKVKTFVVNKVILEKDNPDKNVLRIGKIEFTRDPQRSFISYLWHLIYSGIKSSVGLHEEKTKKEISGPNGEKK